MKLNFLFAIFLLALLSAAAAPATEDALSLFRKSIASFGTKDYSASLKYAEAALQRNPKQPTMIYHLSRVQAAKGDAKQALNTLARAIRMGIAPQIQKQEAYASLKNTPEFLDLSRQCEANRARFGKGDVAYVIPQRDLIAEGITFDPASGRFFVSSIYRRKIIAIDRTGKVTDFAQEKQDGLWGVVGMKVDAKRRWLWANSGNTRENMVLAQPEEDTMGFTGIFKYNIDTGKLLKKYLIQKPGEDHFLNDLTVASNGDVYATDSSTGTIYTIPVGSDELNVFLKSEMAFPNGIALSKDERHLYVAHIGGINAIELVNRSLHPVWSPDDVALTGIDGMVFYQDSLVAVQALEGVDRISRFHFGKDPLRVERLTVYLRNHPLFNLPTTGTAVADSFYFVANSHLRSFDDKGKIFPPEKLSDTFIMTVDLE